MKTNLKRVGGLLLALATIGSVTGCDFKWPWQKNKDNDPGTHTYQGSFSLSPDIFDPLQYKSTSDSVPIDYTTNSLYEFAYNDAGNGFELVHVMAAADPQDVTANYKQVLVDNGVVAAADKDTARDYAFRIALNPDAKWENGDAITADDYIYTMKTLFRSDLNCYRASNYYQGGAAILNAKEYFYSGKEVMLSDENTLSKVEADLYFSIYAETVAFTDDWFGGWFENNPPITSINGLYEDYYLAAYKAAAAANWDADDLTGEGAYAVFAGKTKADFADYDAYEAALIASKFDPENSKNAGRVILKALVDKFNALTKVDSGAAKGYVKYADIKTEFEDFTTNFIGYPQYGNLFCSYIGKFDVLEWDDVGIKKVDDYTLDIIYKGTISGFYQKYSISLPLVHEATYEACISTDPVTGAVTSSYGTSVDKYMGYGPYKFTKYVNDQIMEFDRNENWFGYSDKYADVYGNFVAEFDGKEHRQYETDRIVLKYVKDISTREQMFLAGELDGLGCNAALFKKYKTSDRLYNATGAATFYGILCSDYDALVEREAVLNGTTYDAATYNGADQQFNKTILSIKEFRQAFCYCLDRSALIAALYPAGSAATSLFSNLIIADPENGVPFNSFESTMKAVCDFWGVNVSDYGSLEEAYNAISGYNPEAAKVLLEQAVTKAKDAGLMGNSTKVKLDYCASTDSETEQLWYQTFKACLENLVEGTSLEGKFEYDYKTNLGSDFGGAIQSGKADTAWGFGWSGGELDPYDLVQVFLDGATDADEPYQYDKWVNRDTEAYNITLSLDVDGTGAKEYTYTAFDWYQILNGVDMNKEGLPNWKYQMAPDAVRAEVLAAIEKAILEDYTSIPLFNEGSLQLLSYKCNYGKEKYIFGMGFGGLRYMTYNYTDVEWSAFVNAQPNKVVNY